MFKTTLNGGYFEGMYQNDECKNPINKKITPDGLDGVSRKFMTHLRYKNLRPSIKMILHIQRLIGAQEKY